MFVPWWANIFPRHGKAALKQHEKKQNTNEIKNITKCLLCQYFFHPNTPIRHWRTVNPSFVIIESLFIFLILTNLRKVCNSHLIKLMDSTFFLFNLLFHDSYDFIDSHSHIRNLHKQIRQYISGFGFPHQRKQEPSKHCNQQ